MEWINETMIESMGVQYLMLAICFLRAQQVKGFVIILLKKEFEVWHCKYFVHLQSITIFCRLLKIQNVSCQVQIYLT